MAEMKLINSNAFTATNAVRSAATITVLVLCLSVAQGENLTTLDGKTYTNITEITKYPKQVFLTCNSNRIGLQITNLPEDFRARHGIIIKTNTPIAATVPVQPEVAAIPEKPELSPSDLFLWQNRKSDLLQSVYDNFTVTNGYNRRDIDMSFWLGHAELSLSSSTTIYFGASKCSPHSHHLEFDIGQEDFISKVCDKFLEWEKIAATNHAENFSKEIAKGFCPKFSEVNEYLASGIGDHTVSYVFIWSYGEASLGIGSNMDGFNKDEIIHFQSFLKRVPEMKEKLTAAIRAKETQKDLFK
jgi:hypothetical protein